MELSGLRLFDRRFIIAASVIGALYPSVVLASGLLGGKDDAGWAGLAIAVVATALFTRFETHHFRRVAMVEQLPLDVLRFSLPRVALLCLCFAGVRVFAGGLLGIIVDLEQFTKSADSDSMDFATWFLANWQLLLVALFFNSLSYLAAGYLIKKCLTVALYSEIVIGALLALVLGVAVAGEVSPNGAQLILSAPDVYFEELRSTALGPAAFWLLYASGAFFGARLAEPAGMSGLALRESAGL